MWLLPVNSTKYGYYQSGPENVAIISQVHKAQNVAITCHNIDERFENVETQLMALNAIMEKIATQLKEHKNRM